MFGAVQVSRRSLDEYRPHVGDETIDQLRRLATPLRGARVLHLSISPFGTNVADLLQSLVPLMRDLGIQADWQIAGCDDEFGRVASLLYRGLSGRRVEWASMAEENWRLLNKSNASLFDGSYDLVVVHDPQPAGLLEALVERRPAARRGRWVWHCHLDLQGAQPEVWETFLPALRHYDAWVLADRTFAPPGPQIGSPGVIPPAIDPTSARNMELPRESVRQFLSRYGLDPGRPLVLQVGPFDASFDPLGALEVYRRAKAECPELQLLLVHSIAETSLDAWSRFERVARHVGADSGAQVLCGQGDGGQVLVNAAQRAAGVVLQRCVPAGFSLAIWESFWKRRPVVAGASGGLPLQVTDSTNGYLASDDDAFVERLVRLISDRAEADRLGAAGRRLVRERYLITRFLADELRLSSGLLSSARSAADQEVPLHA